jgi:hypothetical protein
MTWADVCPEQVGARVADHLRVIYQRNAEKTIACEFGVHEATAKGWLAGSMPANKHLTKMISRWGKTFLDFIYSPVIGVSDIDTRLERALAEITAIQAETRRIRGGINRNLDGAVPHVEGGDQHPRGQVVAATQERWDGVERRRADRRQA